MKPGLFGQNHNNSSRDYSNPDVWGKNQFNSSFPASLVAYMSSQGIAPIYLKTDADNNIVHDYITPSELYCINPMSKNAFYMFESGFPAYDRFYTGAREKIDLVMVDSTTDTALIGLEIKLTAIPDNTTKNKSEDKYGCEIVVRPPTINFIACSICHAFSDLNGKNMLKNLLGDIHINHWEEINEVLPRYSEIRHAIMRVSTYLTNKQTPLIVNAIWKTIGGKPTLAEDCLDVFVWSNLAVIQMFNKAEQSTTSITRHMRAMIWLYLMLFEYCVYNQFDYRRIIRLHSYNTGNDKAFALSGNITHKFLSCDALTHPRISKQAIKRIILGGGQNLLSPERRFDAVIVNSPDLFEE
ncbi:MAG: HindVP family restriction endonuclease [Bacteroides sp.]|nr:HindVP family restriction endonuclease [Bacteroides sp.]